MELSIAGTHIGDGYPIFVIAEIGINHRGSREKAIALIDAAAASGADAVKMQTYITEKRVPADSPLVGILKECELSFDDQRSLFSYAKEKGIQLFSTPFDENSVAFLEEMAVPCYKVASFDLVNQSLLKHIAMQGRPVILSCGMANQEETDSAVSILCEANTPFILLHCISAYPVPQASDLHLCTIRALRERYDCLTGYSDHSQGIEAAAIAAAAGATVIEKHFMLAGDADAPDHPVSFEPEQFSAMVEAIRHVSAMLGDAAWGPLEAEAGILQFRRFTQP